MNYNKFSNKRERGRKYDNDHIVQLGKDVYFGKEKIKRKGISQSAGFRCVNCKNNIGRANVGSEGTIHRDHCSFCLASVHVDNSPGDRLSTCKGVMMPIGMSMKKDGEAMVVYECVKCGKVHCNRCAADDNTDTIIKVFVNSLSITEGSGQDEKIKKMRERLKKADIQFVKRKDAEELFSGIFGRGSIPDDVLKKLNISSLSE